jgi:hypothetical protein
MSFDEQPDKDYKWDIHYHDYSTEHKVRVIAHCKHCARCRFERKNTDCVVLAVAPVADEQPDGDIHGECAAEIRRLEQWQNEAASLLATLIRLSSRPDELEWSEVASKATALLAEEGEP